MNLYTRYLAGRQPDGELEAFIAAWDRLEALVIAVYRAGRAGAEDEAEWAVVRPRLRSLYGRWQVELASLWPETKVGGEAATADPFLALLAVDTAAGFVANWRAMQTLPAAREALNRLLLLRG